MGRFTSTPLNIGPWHRGIALRGILVGLLCTSLSTPPACAPTPALPAVDLIVQIRVIGKTDLAAEAATSQSPHASPKGLEITSAVQAPLSARTQAIRVRNGRSAEVSWSQALPIQWLQAGQYRSRPGGTTEGGIVNGLVWLHSGQSLSVQPRWSGGRDPVQVDFRIETQGIEERHSTDIPAFGTQAWASTMSVPWGQWTTFATTGTAQPPSDGTTWSTQSSSAPGLQFMQLRVTRY